MIQKQNAVSNFVLKLSTDFAEIQYQTKYECRLKHTKIWKKKKKNERVHVPLFKLRKMYSLVFRVWFKVQPWISVIKYYFMIEYERNHPLKHVSVCLSFLSLNSKILTVSLRQEKIKSPVTNTFQVLNFKILYHILGLIKCRTFELTENGLIW